VNTKDNPITATLYKFLDSDKAIYGRGSWYLPRGKRPGKWMPLVTNIRLCRRGYHVMYGRDRIYWLHRTMYEVEIRGNYIIGNNKIVAQQARLLRHVDEWNDRSARLFACACAAKVLPIFEQHAPDDTRPREAIAVSRRYAVGRAMPEEVAAAAAAARAAARTAGAAARTAAAAAGAAAEAAAGAAAWDAAWDAAWAWQSRALTRVLRAEKRRAEVKK